MKSIIAVLIGMALLSAPDGGVSTPAAAATPDSVAPARASAPGSDRINADLHRHIAELASDAYEGREPGTPGEDKTVAYLRKEFQALGLEPGNRGQWFQSVPITSVNIATDVVLALRGPDFSADLSFEDQMVVFTWRQQKSVALEASELVFAGYGINAPERGWNDYQGIDVTGKTVVVLVNDPGFATQNPALFNGNAMTYYGRWTYKYEEAARQGAAGVIIVHETDAAGYPWEVVRNSWSGTEIGLTAKNRNADKAAVHGWIPLDQAEALFHAAGMDYGDVKAAAAKPGFTALPMGGITASVRLENTMSSQTSRNVLALIPGTSYPEEVIIYTSHWDHLGVRPGVDGDDIYNGAADNASGVAALLALARQFKEQETAPERSVLFLAVTAEESGLLGSRWYGENPVFPLQQTVANLNMDYIAAGTIGPTRDVALVGLGNSELDDYLAEAVAEQGRVVVPEPFPEQGFYYRSDHFSFARVGVPALFLNRPTDSTEHGKAWGEARLNNYFAQDYHKPSDEYDPAWDLRGAVQEVQVLYAIGKALAANRDFPKWSDGVEFKAIRAKTFEP